MITLLIGENSYEIHHQLRQREAAFEGTAEKIDGVELELRQLPDLLMGMSLFAEKRLIIIRDLSQNKSIWEVLPEWLGRLSDDVQLVLVETTLDKRTKTYKALQKIADVCEYQLWSDRDIAKAEGWVGQQAAERGIKLPPVLVRFLVARVGVDQWQLSHALDKLGVLDEITEEVIRTMIDARPSENVFELFQTALKGDRERVQAMIQTLAQTEDPYRLFGLLSGQAFQLAALGVAHADDDVAKDFGVHPYAVSRLRPYAKQRHARETIEIFCEADETMKTSAVDPWLVIEQALLKVATT